MRIWRQPDHGSDLIRARWLGAQGHDHELLGRDGPLNMPRMPISIRLSVALQRTVRWDNWHQFVCR